MMHVSLLSNEIEVNLLHSHTLIINNYDDQVDRLRISPFCYVLWYVRIQALTLSNLMDQPLKQQSHLITDKKLCIQAV